MEQLVAWYSGFISSHLPPPHTTDFNLRIDKKLDRRSYTERGPDPLLVSHVRPGSGSGERRRGCRLTYVARDGSRTKPPRISSPPPAPQVPTHHDLVTDQQDTAAAASSSHTPRISDDDAYGGKQCRASSLISFQPCFLKGTYAHDLVKITQRCHQMEPYTMEPPDGAIYSLRS